MVFSKTRNVALVLAAFLSYGVAQDPPKPPDKPQKMAKDQAEADLITSIAKDPDANNRLKSLDKWAKDYPETAYAAERQKFYLVTYQQLNRTKDAFNTASEILKSDPNDELALRTIISAMYIFNPPDAGQLDAGEKASNYLLSNLDTIYAPDKKPGDQNADAWEKLKSQMKAYAQKALGVIAFTRKDNPKAEAELTKTLQMDPTQAQASLLLANALLAQRTAHPEKQPASIFEFVRAAYWDGANSLPADYRKQLQASVAKTYKQYHGSDEGFDQLVALAKTNALAPEGFTIKDIASIKADEVAAENAKRAANPMMAIWTDLKTNLTGDGGQAYFDEQVKDRALPKFKGTLVSMSPVVRPTKLVLAVEKPGVPDATLKLEEGQSLPGKMDPGAEIEFEGVGTAYTKEPYMLTLNVDKSKITGWAGKNAPAPAKKTGASSAKKKAQ